MANQKTSDLRRMLPGELAVGDLFPVVDVSEPTSPTGENKKITVEDFATYVYTNYTPSGYRFVIRATLTHSDWIRSGSINPEDVLPTSSYVLTSVVCSPEAGHHPVISVGTGDASPPPPPTGSSVTGSWNDNRVYQTECIYDSNYLEVSNYGSVHTLRTIYVKFHNSSECTCSFVFEGYAR